MKINPSAIHTYRQLEQQNRPVAVAVEAGEQALAGRMTAISPQNAHAGSRVAVSAPKADYTEYLTPEERQAFEVVFHRFHGPTRIERAYQPDQPTPAHGLLAGRIIDVKA